MGPILIGSNNMALRCFTIIGRMLIGYFVKGPVCISSLMIGYIGMTLPQWLQKS